MDGLANGYFCICNFAHEWTASAKSLQPMVRDHFPCLVRCLANLEGEVCPPKSNGKECSSDGTLFCLGWLDPFQRVVPFQTELQALCRPICR
jgi:hypothetical protein